MTTKVHVEPEELDESFDPVELPEDPANFLKPEETAVGLRDDQLALLYPGKAHTVYAETEAGKTWYALLFVSQEIKDGRDVAYVDFEDSAKGIVRRLVGIMGRASWPKIREHFKYIRPEAHIDDVDTYVDILKGCDLVILDGMTEAMSLQGCDDMKGSGVAEFNATWIRPLNAQGITTLTLDHVVKNKEGRDRYATGSVHKLNAIDGASFMLLNREPFGIGLSGHSAVYISKDRPGYLRQHAVDGPSGLKHVAELYVKSKGDKLEISLGVPEKAPSFRPTVLMERISRFLEDAEEALSKNEIEAGVKGQADARRTALELLVTEGYVTMKKKGRAHLHTSVKPFRKQTDDEEDDLDVEF